MRKRQSPPSSTSALLQVWLGLSTAPPMVRRSSRSVATEVEQFGIKITVVAPGFFHTDLLVVRNVRWPTNVIENYVAEGDIPETWSAYHGKQQGDLAKLGLEFFGGMEQYGFGDV